MNAAMPDPQALSAAYTRISDRFKAFWTFHQFLQGLRKTFAAGAPTYQVDFQKLYDQIKTLPAAISQRPSYEVRAAITRFESALDHAREALAADDESLSPSYVRRFFERVRTEDEKLLLSILKFYFYAPSLSHDALDKVDYILTLLGSRKSLDDGRYLPRFQVELERVLAALVALVPRAPVKEALAQAAMDELESVRKELDGCDDFGELARRRLLARLRDLKHGLGPAFHHPGVLYSLLNANLAAKNRFQALYESEERRIQESALKLLEFERELTSSPSAPGADLHVEFARFHQVKKQFEENRERGVRAHEVIRLAESIEHLLARIEVQTGTPPREKPPEPPRAEPAQAAVPPSPEPARPPRAAAPPLRAMTDVERDPLLAAYAARVLDAVELAGGEGGAARLARLRLEPWEARAVVHVLTDQLPGDRSLAARDLLFFEAAVVRIRLDDEAQKLRAPDGESDAEVRARLVECAALLQRSQELDRRFRQEVDTSFQSETAVRQNEVSRSRVRLLRSFSGLWLLHNRRTGG